MSEEEKRPPFPLPSPQDPPGDWSYVILVLVFILYKVVVTFKALDKILKCDHSNESYGKLISSETVYLTVEVDPYS